MYDVWHYGSPAVRHASENDITELYPSLPYNEKPLGKMLPLAKQMAEAEEDSSEESEMCFKFSLRKKKVDCRASAA